MAAIVLALAACVSDPPPTQSGGSGGSGVGGWQLDSASGCTQHLVLSAEGRFTLAAWQEADLLFAVHQGEGNLSTPGGMNGQFAARFYPDSPPATGSDLYCLAWNQNPPVPLPMNGIGTALQVDPLALVYTPSFVPELGVVLTGTDSERRERLILYRNKEGALTAIQADAGYPGGIFRALPGDQVPVEGEISPSASASVVILPSQFWQAAYAGGQPGTVQARLLLVLRAGSEVTFSRFPNSSAKACSFRIYSDLLFTPEPREVALESQSQSATEAFNPAAGWDGYPTWPMSDTTTAYLVPVAIATPTNDPCEAFIHARALSDQVAEAHANSGGPVLFSTPLPEGVAYLTGWRSDAPGRLERIPLGMAPFPFGVFKLSGSAMARPVVSASSDPLHLADGSTEAALISVQGNPATSLNIYPSAGARTGWGPFVRTGQPESAELVIPGSASFTATAPGQQSAFRIQVTATQRIAIWSESDNPAIGHLADSQGHTLALSGAGEADGAGFRMEMALQPGVHVLRITALAAGEFGVHVDVLAQDAPFADPALHACLVEAGWSQNVRPRSLHCTDRGIRDLTGIEALSPELEELNLARNVITDLLPLQSLIGLRTLVLAGNPITDLAPLENHEYLRRLSLAETPVTVSDVTAIAMPYLGANLALLDLTGIAEPLESEMEALRAAYPFTVIIGPSGAAVP